MAKIYCFQRLKSHKIRAFEVIGMTSGALFIICRYIIIRHISGGARHLLGGTGKPGKAAGSDLFIVYNFVK